MGEYDAFGRKVDEDTLEGLGGHSQSAATPQSMETASVGAAPAAERTVSEPPPMVVAADTPSAAPRHVSTSQGEIDLPLDVQQIGRGFVRVVRLFVALITLAIIGSVAWSLSDFDRSDFNIDLPALTIPSFSPEVPTTPEPVTPAKPAKPPVGLEPGSLIRRTQFSRAMALLRSRDLGQITNLRVAADRIDVQLLAKGGRLRVVQITPGPKLRELSLSGPGYGHLATLRYSSINTAAPARFTRDAARRLGTSPDRVNYLVFGDFGDELIWSLFFKNGRHFQADAAGHITRRGS